MTAVLNRATDGLDALAAVSLAEMEAHAALLIRTDRKYVVPTDALPELLVAFSVLDPDLRVLEIDGRRSHRYASTYLDTPELEAFWRSARRRRRRFKVRSRDYLDTGVAFTEVKTRGPRGSTVKTRVPRGDASTDVLPAEDAGFVRSKLAHAGLSQVDVDSLVPTLRTTYLRSSLWLRSSGARVTIDTDVAWALPWSDETVQVADLAIVETKTSSGGRGVDRALWARGHRPVRLSKYGTGLALMLPELPAHRWNRVLTRHLRPHTVHHQIQELS